MVTSTWNLWTSTTEGAPGYKDLPTRRNHPGPGNSWTDAAASRRARARAQQGERLRLAPTRACRRRSTPRPRGATGRLGHRWLPGAPSWVVYGAPAGFEKCPASSHCGLFGRHRHPGCRGCCIQLMWRSRSHHRSQDSATGKVNDDDVPVPRPGDRHCAPGARV